MNTGNRKKLIILGIIIVIVIIIIISLSILLNSEKQKLPNIVANETNTQQENIKEEEEEEKIDVSKYYAVTNLVRQYYGALDKEKYILSDGTNYAEEEGVKESIYSLLSTEYTEKNNVEIDNIYEKVSDITPDFVHGVRPARGLRRKAGRAVRADGHDAAGCSADLCHEL